MAKHFSGKRALINQANSQVVVITGVAAFVVIFSLVACRTLISQAKYQSHVISAKKTAVSQLKNNIAAVSQLKTSYQAFVGQSTNIISGSSTGTGPQDGNNAQIVLDALPSSYDFPALATSLEKLITNQNNLTINSITGTDDEVAQSGNQTSGAPQSVPMPFQLSVTGDYQSIQGLINQFEHSIRPFQIQNLTISGDQSKLTANITAQTYYQPGKEFAVKQTKVVK